MKNFKLKAVRLGRRTRTGKNIYVLSGSDKCLDFYREEQGEFLREDDNGNPLFFTSTLTQTGDVTYNAENERFYVEPDFASLVMIDAAKNMFSTPTAVTATKKADADDPEADDTEADFEEPAKAKAKAKPTATKKKLS